jgi:hypothetical protein
VARGVSQRKILSLLHHHVLVRYQSFSQGIDERKLLERWEDEDGKLQNVDTNYI